MDQRTTNRYRSVWGYYSSHYFAAHIRSECRVLHRWLLQQLARVAAHGNALATALRVPEHARLSRAGLHLVAVGGSTFADDWIVGIGSRDRGDADGFADSVELMVTGIFLISELPSSSNRTKYRM